MINKRGRGRHGARRLLLKRLVFACLPVACALPNTVQAHHGLDFILVQTAHLPERGSGYAFARLNHLSESEDETEIEPAVLYGAADRIAVEAHAHYAKEGGGSFTYESIAPAVHFRLTSRERPLAVGISAEYAFASGSGSADVADVAAIAGYERGRWMAAANLLYEKLSGAAGEWGYAAGIRRTFGLKHGIGVEALGSFESDGYSEMMVGYYGELSEQFTINAGIGTKIDEGPDQAFHMTFIWRFK